MKKITIAGLFVFSVTVSSSVIAAQDQLLIEQARKSHPAHDAQEQEAQQKPSAPSTAKKLVLPLDHGPHAQVTPWVNEQRRLHAEDEAKMKLAEPNKSSNDANGK